MSLIMYTKDEMWEKCKMRVCMQTESSQRELTNVRVDNALKSVDLVNSPIRKFILHQNEKIRF